MAEFFDFQQIQAALSGLVFAHERLGLAEALGKIYLAEPRFLPDLPEQLEQEFLPVSSLERPAAGRGHEQQA